MLAGLAALALLAPLAAPADGASASATLQVSARVIRSMEVSVDPAGLALQVRAPLGEVSVVPLTAAAPGVEVAPHAEHAGHVVVTVLLDAPPTGERRAPLAPRIAAATKPGAP